MKRIAIALLAGVAAFAGLGYSASAADLAVAPPPPPPPSWTGFYIGVHAGAAWQQHSAWSVFDPATGLFATSDVSGTAALGAVGGIQGGYNWQFAPAWVVGVEGDFSWASLSESSCCGAFSGIERQGVVQGWLCEVSGFLHRKDQMSFVVARQAALGGRVLLVDLRARSQRVGQLGDAAAGEFPNLVAKCVEVRFQGAERFRVCSLDLIDNFVLHVCNNFR
jgi:opacity protein-like surface antigen